MKLKVGTKITLGFFSMVLLIIVLGLTSFFSINSSKDNAKSIGAASERLLLEMNLENEFISSVANIRGFIALGDEQYYNRVEDSLNKTLQMEGKLLEVAREDKKPEVQNLIHLTNQYKKGVLEYLSPVVWKYHQEMKLNNTERARELSVEMNSIARSHLPLADLITKKLHELVMENDEIVRNSLKSSMDTANKTAAVTNFVSIFAIIAAIVLSIFLSRSVRNPILHMVSGAVKFAEGDFRESVKTGSSDELGDLSIALNKMRQNFIEVVNNLKASSKEIKESAEQLASQSQQTAAGASETAATVGEIASIVENMSQNTQAVSGHAAVASQHAGKGHRGIEAVTGQMREIAVASSQVGASVDALNAAIGNITQFIEIITNIADQTNLLALNAAIEAARAGEAGRGFAVVAEEVRQLAEQSAQSAKEIKQLIEEIEGQSMQAVKAMADGREKVEQGDRIVAEVGQNFNDIINSVQELTGQVQSIAAAAQQVSAGVQNVAGTTEEQTAAMEEVSSATETLNRMAEELNALVLKFKV